ncbi:MAG: CPBP family intramembrane metalloprotease [Planctomycetia bacterium]|nr:CPBP family intramembrane metalloprotease [Planctomycetia bacterium]
MHYLTPKAGRPAHRRFVIPAYRSVPYRKATRHPWSCLLFLLPLLAAYEVGVVWVGGTQADALRNGVDAWLRWTLESFGLNQLYWVPALVALIFIVWSIARYEDRPNDLPGVWLGMAIESVVFGLGLWGLSRALGPLIDAVAIEPAPATAPGEGVAQVVTYVGAGIYEELVFRLVLYSGLVFGLRAVKTPALLAVPLAAMVSATLFAGAHHIGPYGEAFDDYVFLFRVLAGLYFAALYQFRGFGIAVGAHACFDVLVG